MDSPENVEILKNTWLKVCVLFYILHNSIRTSIRNTGRIVDELGDNISLQKIGIRSFHYRKIEEQII